MFILLVVILVAGLGAMLASRFMWWATGQSPVRMIAAGLLLTVIVFATVIVVAWLVTRSLYGAP